jgi:hypothetical protein
MTHKEIPGGRSHGSSGEGAEPSGSKPKHAMANHAEQSALTPSELERRREWLDAVQREASGVLDVEIVGPTDLLRHPNKEKLTRLLSLWVQRRPAVPDSLCVLCDHEWNLEQELPAAYVILRPWEGVDTRLWKVGAICGECVQRPNLLSCCMDALTQIWPGGRAMNIHVAPRGVS